VIGGTRLEGGKISLPGALWGTGLSVLLQGGLAVLGVTPFLQLIAVGTVLIVAVSLDRIRFRRRMAT
jgi:ribose transport system permease protein